MTAVLNEGLLPARVFQIKFSQLRRRLDAEYNRALLATRVKSQFNTKRIREITISRTGGTPSKARVDYWQGAIPWASPKDFGSFYLTDTEDHISEAAVAESATTVVSAKTLLIVFRSGVLQHSLPVTVTTRETAINQDLKALICVGDASAEYLGVYFTVFGDKLLPLITKSGATVQSINSEQFEELAIPVPPKETQECIVKKLVTAEARRHKTEERVEELLTSIDGVLLAELGMSRQNEPSSRDEKQIFRRSVADLTGQRWDPNFLKQQAKFLRVIETCIHPVRKLREFLAGIQYGISERATEEIVGVPMLRMLNLQDGGWSLSDLKYIAMDDAEKRSYLLKEGDILFNRTNSKELVGKSNVFNLEGEFVFASYLMRVSLKQDAELLPEYVVAFLSSSLGRLQVNAVSRQIAGMTNINAEEVRELLIPVPPLPVQEKICQRVAVIRTEARDLRNQAAIDLESTKQEIQTLILGAGATE